MKIIYLIPLCFLVPINAEKQPISKVPDYRQPVGQKPQIIEKGITAVTGACTIEKNIFYSASGTFYTTVKLGDCDTKLKAEPISRTSEAAFNQCAIKPNCSSSTNIDGFINDVRVWNPFFPIAKSEVPSSPTISIGDVYGPSFRRNLLGFAVTYIPGLPSFFESLINEGIISNPTLCLAVKSSCNFNTEDKAAGKLLIGKSILKVFPKSYAKFGSFPWDWILQLTAASICGKNILTPNIEIYIDTSTPYIVMDKGSYTIFLNKLQNDFGVECLDDGPTNEGRMNVCYLDCAMASKLPHIGLTLGSIGGAAPTVEYFLKNNLIKFGGEDSDDRCSLAIASSTYAGTYNWSLGTSFFNGRTVCFERTSSDNAVYIGSSSL